eukprot:TRINITY_DN682_c0_g1_i1.p1 TRINITY_DN682_c0_g1~~TRINITY_DN682_c0_g1_i1.p1  ORF type:complete len:522 (-),score=150.92 TRINITY_DN682_c0_g1_i1:92-1657(-)
MMMSKCVVVYTVLVTMLMSSFVNGAQITITPSTSNWKAAITGLQPGDVATFSAGTYDVAGYYQFEFNGAAGNPIVIQAKAGDKVVITQSANQNTMNIKGSFFQLKGFDVTGSARGIRLTDSAHDLLIEGVKIHDVGATALSANDSGNTYYNIIIRGCEIYNTADTGECLYFGCTTDGCRVKDTLIENNVCHDTQNSAGGSIGSAFQVKPGSYNVTARNNLCYNVKSVCILFYDDYDRGVNIIEGNVVLNTIQDAGIQATAGALIRNNVVLNAGLDGISIIPNSVMSGSTVRKVTIIHNTVIGSAGNALRLNSIPSSPSITIANNVFDSDGTAIKSSSDLSGVVFSANAIRGAVDANGVPASTYISEKGGSSEFASVANYNTYPVSSSSSLVGKGDSKYTSSNDFNQNARSTASVTIGAYQYSTPSNPGWIPTKTIKPSPTTAPTPTPTKAPTKAPTPAPTPAPTQKPQCMCPCACSAAQATNLENEGLMSKATHAGSLGTETAFLWVFTSILAGILMGRLM